MGNIIEDKDLRNKILVFEDRSDAGKKLSLFLSSYKDTDSIVFAIPSGGVPVGKELKDFLSAEIELLVVRKIQIPWNPEAGFGAMNLDGDVILNESLIRSLELSEAEILSQIEKTREILNKRNKLFRGNKSLPSLKNKVAIIVDDGVASGYTMIAGIEYVKKREPEKIIVAVPTGSWRTVKRISEAVDFIYCLNIREGYPYAVADAYRNWYDLTDEEVLMIIKDL
uniref:Phosphoribosyltransferase n=1 Tax=Thermodesulfovibrio aggregans TaxID=86166 RepID=A0A7C4AJJ1_9BACT